MVYDVEKNSKEWIDKLPAESKTRLEAAIERARKALRGDDMNEIRSAQEELNRVFNEAGQTFYAQNQGAGAASPPGGEAAGGPTAGEPAAAGARAGRADDVVEADYEIVDEDKK
jgi:molecular chaperone DnaK